MQAAPRYFSSNAGILGTQRLEALVSRGETVSLAEAILLGQAPDGGLLMPDHIPKIDGTIIKKMRGWGHKRIFVEVMMPYFAGTLPRKTLERIAQEAYTFKPFIEPIGLDYIDRLDNGPTASFKDFGLQAQRRFIEALRKDESLLTIITSTSGDTGGAVAAAYHGMKGVWVVILYPAGKISDLQAKQMDTLGGNICVMAVENTNFDGCQKLALQLQRDPDLHDIKKTSANSVNIGRFLPQIAYYFHAYSKVARPNEEVYFAVPSGNFGNADAGVFARRAGLSIKLIIAVNENDVFKRFHDTGVYKPASEAVPCPSSAMEVNLPSNMRRLFQLYGGQLIGEREVKVMPDMDQLKREIAAAYSISNDDTDRAVKGFYDEWHMIGTTHSTLEPHGAVAWEAAKRFRADTGYNGKIIVFETAHPGKFPESLIKQGITDVELPDCLARLVHIPHGFYHAMPNDYGVIKSKIRELHAREVARLRI